MIDESGGSLPFSQFMHEALYAKGLGYYSAGATKFGTDGDFTTAPEVSKIFGNIVARQCSEILDHDDGGTILEIGAGSGKLAADLLEVLAAQDRMPARYDILEVSSELAERQAQTLRGRVPHLVDQVQWLDAMPTSHRGVIVANEVLDAMPVERFRIRGASVMRICVGVEGDEFVWREQSAPPELRRVVAQLQDDIGRALPEGFTSEISLAIPNWIADLRASLSEGVLLLFDYGVSRREYYAVDRDGGWLRCHFRHHAHCNPLILPGIQDLTAWVDYSAVATAAVKHGFQILGYTAQAQFVLGGGLESVMQSFAELSTDEQLKLSREVKTLTLPGEMGENFKCIALGVGNVCVPSGFDLANRTRTL